MMEFENNQNEEHDINYFDQVLTSLRQSVDVPLQTRRQEIHNPDPIEELMEVYDDVQEVETNLCSAIEIAYVILNKNKEMISANYDL